MRRENLISNKDVEVKLEKAYTFFMVPFYYDNDDWSIIHAEKLNKWTSLSTELYKEDVLYPYIMDLFKQQSSSQKTRLDIYDYKSKDKGVNSQLFVDRILGKKQMALIAKNAEEKVEPKLIQFRLMNEKNFAPHLFISPSAKIGIFTFSIELLGNKNMEDLVTLNYFLHKRNESGKYQCVCLKPEEQDDAVIAVNYESINNQIPDLWKQHQKSTMKNSEYICWNLNDFVDCLLATMGKPKERQRRLNYFSKDRMHLFTFCSIQDENDAIQKEDIMPNILRLSRCVSTTYMLPFEDLIKQGATLQTYDNIFYSSSIEGAAMICIGKKDNSEFIKGIHEKFNRQYLLIYLLVLIQRYTLQSLERLITELESSNKQSDDKLWDIIDVICRIKVNCYYTDVSIYTHHSQFYQHCCKNLHIPESFEEIGGKIELLKMTTERRMHIILQEQKTLMEEEKDAVERRQHMLNWVVAILTIAQVIQASYEIFSNDFDPAMHYSLILGGLGIVLLVILMWKDIIEFFKMIFK